ncbi:hypothetical protein [Spirillospora sp. NBC_01491]|uniref:hypothetical protein n=1 Tax=Spirillospora sp. NBC_01491 TaxID=2976007 RepID=UPI002E34337A|nr:hypothetical protein [Spirillospora sp. NBC_01491]
MGVDEYLEKYDGLCREVYADTRMPPGTREVALTMGWVMFRHPERPNGRPFWREVKRILRGNEAGKPRLWDLTADDAPRYEQPGASYTFSGSCEGPRHRAYQPHGGHTYRSATIVHAPAGGAPHPHDHTQGGRVCGTEGRIRVLERDMATGWTITRWFCRRHEERAREVQAQLDARGEAPPPIPNKGGLLPCYFKADWEKVYREAVGKSFRGPIGWEPPYYGLAADDWPTPGKQPIPRRPRLSIITGS